MQKKISWNLVEIRKGAEEDRRLFTYDPMKQLSVQIGIKDRDQDVFSIDADMTSYQQGKILTN